MSLLSPTPGMPMWPLAMNGNEASRPETRATGTAMPTAGPEHRLRADQQKDDRRDHQDGAAGDRGRLVARQPDRDGTDQDQGREADRSLEKRGLPATQREQHGAPHQQGREQDYPCREVGSGEGAHGRRTGYGVGGKADLSGRFSRCLVTVRCGPSRLAALAPERQELIERIAPAQAAQDVAVGAAANRVDLLAPPYDLRPVRPRPSGSSGPSP